MLGGVVDGDFEVQTVIGQGSHAEVYRAMQRSVGNRVVALKVLSRHYLNIPESDFRRAAQNLVREGELLGSLHAACFVDVYRTGVLPDQRPYIALEFAEGKTLAQVSSGTTRLRLDQIVDVLHEWAEGLAELHARGFVHRDVTPANAVLSETVFGTQRVQVYDFGTAAPATGRPDRFRTGYDRDRPQGTPAYMSPEVASGNTVDARSDQYQIAAIAYELLTGVRPIAVAGPGAAALLEALRGTAPLPSRSVSELRPDLPASVQEVVHKALSRVPDARFEGVQHFVQALEAAVAGVVPAAPQPVGLLRRMLSLVGVGA